MQAGRKPKSTAQKILDGNPGKRPLNSREPQIEDGIPECPDVLDGEARKEWDRILPILCRARLISVADRAILAVYCQTWARMMEAESKAKSHGLIVKTTNGNLIQNPFIGIAHTCAGILKGYLAELGLSPSSRSRIVVPDIAEHKKSFDADGSEFTGKLRIAK